MLTPFLFKAQLQTLRLVFASLKREVDRVENIY